MTGEMLTVAAEAAPVASAVTTNVFVTAVVVVSRVCGLTGYRLAMPMTSPFLNVSPVVQVKAKVEAPFTEVVATVTAPAHVPAVCVFSDMDSYQSNPCNRPIDPSRYCREMSEDGLNRDWTDGTIVVLTDGVISKPRSWPVTQPPSSINRCRACATVVTVEGSVPKTPTMLLACWKANSANRLS